MKRFRYCQLRYIFNVTKHNQKIQKLEDQSLKHVDKAFEKLEKPVTKGGLNIEEKKPFINLKSSRGIAVKHTKKETQYSAIMRYCLEKDPTPEGFLNGVEIFKSKSKTRHGHIDFITTAMKFIEPYKLEKNMEVYEALMDVFPRSRFKNLTLFDALWPKSHPQLFLALDILTKMEWQHLMPSEKMHEICLDIFGRGSLPCRKIYRMWFWFEELEHLNPYELPADTYKNRTDIIKAAVDRLYGTTDGVEVLQISEPIETEEMVNYQNFLISSQTAKQQKYVTLCHSEQSLYIEGPTHIWVNHKMEKYFVLKASKNGFISDGVHLIEEDEQREGLVLAMCFATSPYMEKMQMWLKHLQEVNPALRNFNIIFNITDENEPDTEQIKVKRIESSGS